jgi:hypothetical protein
MIIPSTQTPGQSPVSDADIQARIKALVTAGIETDPATFGILKNFSFERLTGAQRKAFDQLIELGSHLASTTGDKDWAKAASVLQRHTNKMQTK